jgi:hypothetical protein
VDLRLLVVLACLLAGTACGARDDRAAADAGLVRFDDREFAVAGAYPAGWHHARGLTRLADPREVLALASYPLRGGGSAGECAPDTARADMPADGVFIWLLEYRPARGDVWADLPRSRFPPKPATFGLSAADLAAGVSCFPGRGWSTLFRAAGRPFQLLVAFGGQPSPARLGDVESVLDGLEVGALAPPPPDPHARWPLLVDEPGDSFRPPPGWPAAARSPSRAAGRPRSLFFASNRPLVGLPERLAERAELPSPMPDAALANAFPPDGVLVWVLEEGREGEWHPARRFPAIGPDWPGRADFEPAESLTKPAAGVRWVSAAGSFGPHRFSVWIAAGPQARPSDLELAFESAATLAVSACGREAGETCPGA